MLHTGPYSIERQPRVGSTPADRVVLVVLDGLRSDAIGAFRLYHVARLSACGASTMDATTVAGSRWAAFASLAAGVSPECHGALSRDGQFCGPFAPLTPVPELLAREGLPTTAFFAEIPRAQRLFASRIAERCFTQVSFDGATARQILAAARHTLISQRRGLIVIHLPDLGDAGRTHGWMSPAYGEVATRVDATIGLAAALADVPRDPRTVLVLVSSHGGGGVDAHGYESDHELDRTIPLILGGSPMSVPLVPPVSLLDVPATVLYALGVSIPSSYEGRALREAFFADTGEMTVTRRRATRVR
jgi:hypothetical protein